MDSFPWSNVTVMWKGWATDLETLAIHGWEIEKRHLFRKSERGKPIGWKGARFYLRQPELGVLARFSTRNVGDIECIEQGAGLVCHLDFLVHRKQHGRKSIRIQETATSYGVEDIPVLLDLIQELQKRYPKSKSKQSNPIEELPIAEIIKLVA